MATFDRTYGTAGHHSATESRLDRRLSIDWGAVFGGTALGWGTLLLLSLIGATLGFAAIDPYSSRPMHDGNLASAVWAGLSMIATSVLGAYFVVRLAGDRRRNESLLHGAVSWGVSMIAGALIALFAAGSAAVASGPAAARRASPRDRVTTADRARLDEAADAGARTTGTAAGAAILALVGSLFGALIGASRQSGVSLKNEFRMGSFGMSRHHKEAGHDRIQTSSTIVAPDRDRDQTTILPPTH